MNQQRNEFGEVFDTTISDGGVNKVKSPDIREEVLNAIRIGTSSWKHGQPEGLRAPIEYQVDKVISLIHSREQQARVDFAEKVKFMLINRSIQEKLIWGRGTVYGYEISEIDDLLASWEGENEKN